MGNLKGVTISKILRHTLHSLIYCLFFLYISMGNAQDTLWTRTYDCNGLMDIAYGIATDREGNVIVTGYSEVGQGNYNYHTIKYTPDGDTLWSRTYDGGGRDRAYGIATDGEGNIIVTGCSDSSGEYDYYYYTIKYAPNGDTLWSRYGSVGWAYAVATDRDGNIIVTGVSGSPGSKISGYCTIKYNPEGDTMWTRTCYGISGGEARGIATDTIGNIIVTGYFWLSGYDPDYYTIKYDPNGDTLWTRVHESGGNDPAYGVTTDYEGNIIVTGDSYHCDYYTIKYDYNGNILWTRRYDGGDNDFAYGVATDTPGNIIVTGYSMGIGYYTIKYSPGGYFLWGTRYGSTGYVARGVATDLESNIIVTGYSWKGPGDTYYLTIKYIGESGVEEQNHTEVISKQLEAYPNPFNKFTTISYSMPALSWVTIKIYDLSGREVITLVNEKKKEGNYDVIWDRKDRCGDSVLSGIYFYRLVGRDFRITRKFIILDSII